MLKINRVVQKVVDSKENVWEGNLGEEGDLNEKIFYLNPEEIECQEGDIELIEWPTQLGFSVEISPTYLTGIQDFIFEEKGKALDAYSVDFSKTKLIDSIEISVKNICFYKNLEGKRVIPDENFSLALKDSKVCQVNFLKPERSPIQISSMQDVVFVPIGGREKPSGAFSAHQMYIRVGKTLKDNTLWSTDIKYAKEDALKKAYPVFKIFDGINEHPFKLINVEEVLKKGGLKMDISHAKLNEIQTYESCGLDWFNEERIVMFKLI